jgi:hypothetical protein
MITKRLLKYLVISLFLTAGCCLSYAAPVDPEEAEMLEDIRPSKKKGQFIFANDKLAIYLDAGKDNPKTRNKLYFEKNSGSILNFTLAINVLSEKGLQNSRIELGDIEESSLGAGNILHRIPKENISVRTDGNWSSGKITKTSVQIVLPPDLPSGT